VVYWTEAQDQSVMQASWRSCGNKKSDVLAIPQAPTQWSRRTVPATPPTLPALLQHISDN